jgi:hypothetical protein
MSTAGSWTGLVCLYQPKAFDWDKNEQENGLTFHEAAVELESSLQHSLQHGAVIVSLEIYFVSSER